MADHVPAHLDGNAAPVTQNTASDKTGGSTRFAPRGHPVITGINRVGLNAEARMIAAEAVARG